MRDSHLVQLSFENSFQYLFESTLFVKFSSYLQSLRDSVQWQCSIFGEKLINLDDLIGSLNKDKELLKSKCLLDLDIFQVNLTHGHLVVVQERIQTSGKYFRMTALSSLNIFALVTCITNCNRILRESENGRVCASKTC